MSWDVAESPSLAIMRAAATVTDQTLTDLPALQDFVDTDALDALFDGDGAHVENIDFAFEYDSLFVVISGSGILTIWVDEDMDVPAVAGPTTREELDTAMKSLFSIAERNGVSVAGAYAVDNGDENPTWDVHVTEVRRDADS